MSIQKSEIKLDVNGKSVNAYLASPANGGPGILLLHAWWGLKPFFKELCDQLAEHGYVVLAPDLRGRAVGHTAWCDAGHIVNTKAAPRAG